VPHSIAELLDRPLLGRRPFLTWYDATGRVELSAEVTANWVAKTTNLLVEEHDAGPGTLVALDLPPHWRSAVWALAVWRAGAGLVLDGSRADVVVTDRPGSVSPGPEVVAQAMASLARSFDGELPPGALDAARVVGGYGDVVGWTPPLDPAAPAVVDGTTTPHAALPSWAGEVPAGARLAVRVGGREDLPRLCALALGALRAGSSLVLLHGEHDLERVCATERAEPLGT